MGLPAADRSTRPSLGAEARIVSSGGKMGTVRTDAADLGESIK